MDGGKALAVTIIAAYIMMSTARFKGPVGVHIIQAPRFQKLKLQNTDNSSALSLVHCSSHCWLNHKLQTPNENYDVMCLYYNKTTQECQCLDRIWRGGTKAPGSPWCTVGEIGSPCKTRNDCFGHATCYKSWFCIRHYVASFTKITRRSKACRKYGSTYKEYPGFHIRKHNDKVLHGVSLKQCLDNCTNTTKFICRSADYKTQRSRCDLSTETPKTVGGDFKSTSGCTNYVRKWDSSTYIGHPGFYIRGHNNITLKGVSLEQCLDNCTITTKFVCRSADYQMPQSRCDITKETPDTVGNQYYERRNSAYTNYVRNCE